MTLVVPFDGNELSKMALIRAVQFDTVVDEGVVVVSVIPQNSSYARERGWIGPSETFDDKAIVEGFRNQVQSIAPDAEFHPLSVGQAASSKSISNKVRKFARANNASIVFIGSENAGRVSSSLTVGSAVTADRSYDTMIVSHAQPAKIEELKKSVSTEATIS